MIFAFGPGGDSYYINNGQQSHWRNIPSALATLLRDDSRCSPEKITSLTLFLDDGYFLSATNDMWATNNVPTAIQERITTDIGENKNVAWIQHDSSDASRYQISAFHTPGPAKLFHASQSPELFNTILTDIFRPATFISMGYKGNWAFGNSDRVYSSLSNDNVRQIVMAQGKTIKDVTLSPYAVGHVFVEYTDGTINYWLPNAWHDAIRTIDEAARKSLEVASNPATSRGNHSKGVVSKMAKKAGKEVCKEVGREVGKEIVGALFQAVFNGNNNNNNNNNSNNNNY